MSKISLPHFWLIDCSTITVWVRMAGDGVGSWGQDLEFAVTTSCPGENWRNHWTQNLPGKRFNHIKASCLMTVLSSYTHFLNPDLTPRWHIKDFVSTLFLPKSSVQPAHASHCFETWPLFPAYASFSCCSSFLKYTPFSYLRFPIPQE